MKPTAGGQTINDFPLKPDEVCRIIEKCAGGRVRVLKYAGLYLEFGTPPLENPQSSHPANIGAASGAEIPTTNQEEIQKAQEEVSRDSFVKDEIKTREEQIEELLISDPAEYERLVRDGEIVEDDGENRQEALGG